MKDKLVKTGHKTAYDRLRFLGKAALALSLFSLLFATPMIVAYSLSAQELRAEPTSEASLPEESEESSIDLPLE